MTGIVRPGGHVLIDPDALPGLAELLRDAVARRPSTSSLPPPVRHALAAIDTAATEAAEAMFANEHDPAAQTNMPPGLDAMTTTQLAQHLNVTQTHVRRLAASAGVERLAHGLWPADAAGLIRLNRGTP